MKLYVLNGTGFALTVEASDSDMHRIIRRIAAKFDCVHFCYEAGLTGYGHCVADRGMPVGDRDLAGDEG